MQIESLLEQVPFFSGFSPAQLQGLMAAGELRTQPAQTPVFQEGDPAKELFLIVAGRVQIQRHNAQQAEVVLAEVGPGAFFGELALADGGVRTASVRTLEDCQFFVLSREQFIQELARSPQLLSEVIASISTKIRHSNTQYFEEQLQKQAQLLTQERQRHLSMARMVMGMAHELNTPLGIVQTTTSILHEQGEQLAEQAQAQGPEILEACELIQDHLTRMRQLIQSFKSLSPAEVYTSLETIRWPEFLQAFEELYQQSSYRNLPLVTEISGQAAQHSWWGYPEILNDILMHLLLNAEAHAYPRHAGPVKLSLDYLSASQQFRLEVADQGLGIAEQHLQEVQEPFFTTCRMQGFTGLGLTSVYNWVTTALQGEFKLRSVVGAGTCIEILFPAALGAVDHSNGG